MTDINLNPHLTAKAEEKKATKVAEFFGVELELPEEVANAFIAKRDEIVGSYNSTVKKQKELEAVKQQKELEAAEAVRKAQALEAAKNNDLAKAEELFAQKHREELDRYRKHSYRSAVKAALASYKGLVEGAAEDVLSNILTSNTFSLAEDFSVRAGEKTVETLVGEYVDARPYLKVAETRKPQGISPIGTTTPTAPKVDPKSAWEAAITKSLSRA